MLAFTFGVKNLKKTKYYTINDTQNPVKSTKNKWEHSVKCKKRNVKVDVQ